MQEVKSWSCSFQQRQPRRLGCDCLSNSYRPGVSNLRPVGQIRPAKVKRFCEARKDSVTQKRPKAKPRSPAMSKLLKAKAGPTAVQKMLKQNLRKTVIYESKPRPARGRSQNTVSEGWKHTFLKTSTNARSMCDLIVFTHLQCGLDPRTSGRMDCDVIDVNSTPDESAKNSLYFHLHGSHPYKCRLLGLSLLALADFAHM